MPNKKSTLVALELGPMPHDIVNRTLGLELAAGVVVLSINAQKHAARRHPADYARCQPHVASVILNPIFIGGDFKNRDAIELIARVRAIGSALLVAVSVVRGRGGRYEVISFYPVSEAKIASRVRKGFLFPARRN